VPEKGGELYDTTAYSEGTTRADLVAIASRHSFQHGPKIIDEILNRFNITPKLIKDVTA
jgi:hypothetical protein